MRSLPAARYSVLRGAESWPLGLDALPDPPRMLRVQGTLPCLERAVTIVGTRRADDDALRFAWEVANGLGRAGCVVVSGGALGVDASAHMGALESGAKTVAVMGGGLDRLYPASHRGLFRRIAEQGALVTEHADAVAPRPGRFLRRNRLLAALGRLIVVVQAPVRSGSLSTAAHARALGRPVLVVPAAPWDPRGAGCLQLLRAGATPCRSVADVFAALGKGPGGEPRWSGGEPTKGAGVRGELPSSGPALGGDHRRVLGALGARPRHPDEIARKAGVPASRLGEVLFDLELQGIVEPRVGGRYVRVQRCR